MNRVSEGRCLEEQISRSDKSRDAIKKNVHLDSPSFSFAVETLRSVFSPIHRAFLRSRHIDQPFDGWVASGEQ